METAAEQSREDSVKKLIDFLKGCASDLESKISIVGLTYMALDATIKEPEQKMRNKIYIENVIDMLEKNANTLRETINPKNKENKNDPAAN